ncbi:MAG TPA: hypothetical protein VH476_01460 [Solirubrobacterales bacterium]|jgi:hypothetical protein
MESTYRRSMSVAAGLLAFCIVGAFSAPLAGANTALTFKEPEKGSTFKFVDVAPQAPKKHGFPTAISPGDQFVVTNPLTQGGKTIGKLRARCTATANAKGKNAFANAHFICEGVFSFGKDALYASASTVKDGVEGVITGGTGKYVGASGTVRSKEGKGGSTTTITLIG